ncbi:MAG TPA: hypothetical protein VJT49_18740, partial [Amycolatopsis sp.]|uniref:hypothetical protein n=1 Tax=Amycolatopsis sp. TaxID=37632 RepID=UPI002B4A78B8
MDFTPITNPALRLTAKEYVFALMVPEHEVVIALPDARRTQYKPASVFNMTEEVVRWMNFVSGQGLTSLVEVMQEHCDAYKEIRSERLPTSKRRGGPITEATMVSVLLPVRGLATYREVFSRDAYRPGFVPWKGKSIAQVAGKKSQAHNSTPPIPEEVLQPTVAAALYLVETLGPLVAEEFETLLQTSMNGDSRRPRTIAPWLRAALTAVVDRYVAQQIPLPRNETRHAARRVTRGWSSTDPLLRVDIGRLVNEASHYTRITDEQIEVVRPILEAAVAKVGTAGNFGRDAVQVPRADDEQTLVPWTLPLTGDELRGLAFVVMAACRGLVAALSGMRASELEELTPASLLPPVTVSGGTKRYKLGSKLIKGQRLRGVEEKWVVLEPAYRAVQLAVRLNRAEGDDQAFARSQQDFLHQRLREWVNGPHGQRLGLAPIPPGPVNGRMLRRTTSLELAWRPGGLWAAKIQLKHLSVVASEGYAHYPGGAQATFLA